jgi:hypothetical protein
MVGTQDLSLRIEGYILYPCVVNEVQFRQIDRGLSLYWPLRDAILPVELLGGALLIFDPGPQHQPVKKCRRT